MTHADEARRIVDAMRTCQTNHPEMWLEPIAAAIAAAERRGGENVIMEIPRAVHHQFPLLKASLRALLPESSGNPGELPAEPAAKCAMCRDTRQVIVALHPKAQGATTALVKPCPSCSAKDGGK